MPKKGHESHNKEYKLPLKITAGKRSLTIPAVFVTTEKLASAIKMTANT